MSAPCYGRDKLRDERADGGHSRSLAEDEAGAWPRRVGRHGGESEARVRSIRAGV